MVTGSLISGFNLDLGKWYRVKQALIVPSPVAPATAPVACRLLHRSGEVVECGSFPPPAAGRLVGSGVERSAVKMRAVRIWRFADNVESGLFK